MKKYPYTLKAAIAMLVSLMLCGFIPISDSSSLHVGISNMSAEPQIINSSCSTIISFDLSNISNGSHGKLDIYDTAGAIIRTFNKTALHAGPNNVTWNGRDSNGKPVKDGIYSAAVTISGQTSGPGSNITNGSTPETTIIVDNTPPVTSALLSGVLGNDGWYIGDVTVNLSVIEKLSGVNRTIYRLDSGDWNDYAGNFTVGDGTHTLDYFSVDMAGNSEREKNITINVDAVSPEISSISPEDGEKPDANVTINATFSKPMDPDSINSSTFILADDNGNPVASHISYDNCIASLKPETSLTPGADYTLMVSNLVSDIHGSMLQAGMNRTFEVADSSRHPTVTSTDPANGAENVPLTAAISVSFDQPMLPGSINGDTFIVTTEYGTVVEGTVSYDTNAVFTPADTLYDNAGYTAMITTDAQSADGSPLKDNYTWSFRTESLNLDTGDDQSLYEPDDDGLDLQADDNNVTDGDQAALPDDENNTTIDMSDNIVDPQPAEGNINGFSTIGGNMNRLAPAHITQVQAPKKSLMDTILVITAVVLRRVLLKI